MPWHPRWKSFRCRSWTPCEALLSLAEPRLLRQTPQITLTPSPALVALAVAAAIGPPSEMNLTPFPLPLRDFRGLRLQRSDQ